MNEGLKVAEASDPATRQYQLSEAQQQIQGKQSELEAVIESNQIIKRTLEQQLQAQQKEINAKDGELAKLTAEVERLQKRVGELNPAIIPLNTPAVVAVNQLYYHQKDGGCKHDSRCGKICYTCVEELFASRAALSKPTEAENPDRSRGSAVPGRS